MGGDGGTKATGRKYLRGAKSAAKGDAEKSAKTEAKKEQAVALLSKSALSGAPLEKPVVADATGCLFNKDEIVMGILDKSLKRSAEFSHIRSLKDVVECVLTANPAYKQQRGKATALDGESALRGPAKWMCPLTQDSMNGGQAFCVVRATGAVISQRALRSIPRAALREALGVTDSFSTSLDVAAAGAEADAMDLIVLGMEADGRAAVRAAAVARRKAKKALKKAKKAGGAVVEGSSASGKGGALVATGGGGGGGGGGGASTGSAGTGAVAGAKRKREEMGSGAGVKRARAGAGRAAGAAGASEAAAAAAAAAAAVAANGSIDVAAAGAHSARAKSKVYASLFNTKEKEASARKTQQERNDELFMHGNTRGTVRC